MGRCVIIGGAPIGDYPAVRAYLKPGDYCIYCDSGLRHIEGLGREPDLVVGDFDSHPAPTEPGPEVIRLPREKDDTDTMFAAREGQRRGFRDFLLLGVFGQRLDHSLANMYMLLWFYRQGLRAMAVDDWSEVEVLEEGTGLVEDRFPYFSLVAIAGPARGVTIEGAKYLLKDYDIDSSFQIGVSNQPLPGQTARITLREGCLLLIRDRV